jgi:DNA-nicking Smr family endonuclease
MRRRRRTSADERALFEATLDGKTPPEAAPVRSKAKPAEPELLDDRALFEAAFSETRPHRKTVRLHETAPRSNAKRELRGGLDGNTADRLRKGLMEPEARIDLHGQTEAGAHRTLLDFLRNARRNGCRLALVVTGKGAREQDPHTPFTLENTRGVLKAMVPRWLKEPDFAALIADHRAAHRRHGGTGAMYIYLKKPERG